MLPVTMMLPSVGAGHAGVNRVRDEGCFHDPLHSIGNSYSLSFSGSSVTVLLIFKNSSVIQGVRQPQSGRTCLLTPCKIRR